MISPTWAAEKGLVKSSATSLEISDLLENADQKLHDCVLISDSEISTDTYQSVVFNAAILLMKAVLRASGYQTTKETSHGHDLLVKCLGLTMDTRGKYSGVLDTARRIRQRTTYVAIGDAAREEIDDLLILVKALRADVEKYIRRHYPSLIKS